MLTKYDLPMAYHTDIDSSELTGFIHYLEVFGYNYTSNALAYALEDFRCYGSFIGDNGDINMAIHEPERRDAGRM